MGLGEEGCSVIADGLSIRGGVVIRGWMDCYEEELVMIDDCTVHDWGLC